MGVEGLLSERSGTPSFTVMKKPKMWGERRLFVEGKLEDN